MSRKPTHDYMPNFEDEKHSQERERVSLNKVANSPFTISSHVIDMTKKYNEKNKNSHIQDTWSIDWQSEYLDSYFVPENRWTSEVTYQPVLIKDNLYKIVLPADIYIKRTFDNVYNNDKPEFISRTLYPYISKNFEYIDIDAHDPYINVMFFWVYRWLPKNPCTLTFYTTPEIEESLYIKTPKTTIKIDDSQHNVEVPLLIRKDIFEKLTIIKHDSDILYMEVKEDL